LLLGGFKGIAVTDGYGVYYSLEKRTQGLRIAQCRAHIRRKFVDCESAFPKETEQILGLIRELYAIEDRAPPALKATTCSINFARQGRGAYSRAFRRGVSTWRVRRQRTGRRHQLHVEALVASDTLP